MVGLRQLCDLLELKMKSMPPQLRAPQKQVQILVRYEDPKVRSPREEPLSDHEIITQLGQLVRRTESQAVMAVAAKLALLLKGRPIPMELEAIETSVLPQLSAPEGEGKL